MKIRLLLLISFFIASSKLLHSKEVVITEAINNDAQAAQYFLENKILQLPKSFALKNIYEAHTAVSSHYTYNLTYNGISIFAKKIKLNCTKQGKILTISNNIGETNFTFPAITGYDNEQQNILKNFEKAFTVEAEKIFYASNNTILPALFVRYNNTKLDSTKIFNLKNSQILFACNNAKNFTDTTIRVKVFLPDPLTHTKQNYGGTYINNADANATWLDNALVDTFINASFDTITQKFVLQNAFAKILDINAPNILPVTQASNLFYYNRSQSGFEDVNALFHVSNYKKYINSLGFNNLLNLQLRMDAHGQNGNDVSTFYSTNPPLLELGTGGVNDAEDADVIIHEYAHGLSWSANNNFATSTERQALDEGLADYFATSYSKGIDTFNWQKVFNWDGHNEFWGGRFATTTTNYSTPFIFGIYQGGTIYNNAMMLIWDALGQTITDKLMLQSMYFYTDSTTFTEAANYVLVADTLLYNGIHTNIICEKMWQKNIQLQFCAPLNIPNVTVNTLDINMYNLQEFACRKGNLIFNTSKQLKNTQILIYNIAGKVVATQNLNQLGNNKYYLATNNSLPSGMYFIKLKGFTKTFKILIY